MKRIGKIGKRNIQAYKRLKALFLNEEILYCEVCPVLDDLKRRKKPCLINDFLSFAHRHKRLDYRKCPEMLSDLNQVALACQNGHSTIEPDKELTQQVFQILRGDDLLA